MLRKQIKNFPTHIAFIMDGNRRWAVGHGFDKMLGHKHGAESLKKIIKELVLIKEIKYASFFAFSTENWNRSEKEIDYLFNLIFDFVDKNQDEFKKDNIKFVHMGDPTRLSKKLQDLLIKLQKDTENNTGLVVNLALNYGGRADIVQAANKVVKSGQKEITIENLKQNLYSGDAPDIDLLIRTSGEMRISNFMLFQMAYSEIYFTKTYWPAFKTKELYKAISVFSKRDRRFGGK